MTKRYGEEQIIHILNQAEATVPLPFGCFRYNILISALLLVFVVTATEDASTLGPVAVSHG